MTRPLLAALLLSLAATTLAADRIDNPAQAPAQETWTLQERWRVGADEDDVLLGQVTGLLGGPAGEVYALDTQLAQVLVFDRDGALLRTLGREGDGPGEFRQPIGMFWSTDGHLAVQQAFPGRVVYLDPADGTPVGSWELGHGEDGPGGMTILIQASQRGGTFAAAANQSAFDMEQREIRGTEFLALVDHDGQEVRRVSEVSTVRGLTSMTIDELAEHNPADRGLWALGPDGLIYTVPTWADYRIDVQDRDGHPVRTIARDYQPRLRTDQEKEEQRNSMQMNINGMQPEISWKLQDHARAIQRIDVLDDGTLWVQDSHGRQEWDTEGRQHYGVFGPDGRLLRQVTLDAPLPGEGNRLVLLEDGRIFMIKGLDSLSISISAGDGDDTITSDEPLGDTLLEIICFDVRVD
jgi:hypothetical protein